MSVDRLTGGGVVVRPWMFPGKRTVGRRRKWVGRLLTIDDVFSFHSNDNASSVAVYDVITPTASCRQNC